MEYILPIFLQLTLILSEVVSQSQSGQICDPVLYAQPYVHVYKKRNGQPIESLIKNGFLDLTKQINKIICINGLAILYEDVEVQSDGSLHFTNKDNVQHYIQKCVIVNQLKTSKAIELRDQKRFNPSLLEPDVYDSIVVTKDQPRVAGIYLISAPSDYYEETSVLFRQQGFNYMLTSDDRMTDASFVTVTSGPFCLTVDGAFDIKLQPDPADKTIGEQHVCHWTLADEEDAHVVERYKKIFNGSLPRQSFKWYTCSTGRKGGPGLGPYPSGLPLATTQKPLLNLDPFSIIGSNMAAVLGARAKKLGRRLKSRNQARSKNFELGKNTNWAGATTDDVGGDFTIFLNPEKCFKLPDKPTGCSVLDVSAENCDIFAKALAIEDKPTEPPAPIDNNPFTFVDDLLWKKEVLDVSSEIFGKICEPFPKDMPFTISRIIEYYVKVAHNKDPNIPKTKPPMWDMLLSELNRCNSQAKKPMLWYWDNRDDLYPPDPVEPVKCVAESCSPGCAVVDNGDGTDPECKEDVNFLCPSATPTCPSPCVYETTSKTCIDSPGKQAQIVSENDLNTIIETELDDCSAQKPTCSKPECVFKTDGTCAYPECKVVGCSPNEDCKPNFEHQLCEPRTLSPDSGAIVPKVGTMATSPDLTPGPSGPTVLTDKFPFKNPYNQEIIKKKPPSSYNFDDVPVNVLVITNITEDTSTAQVRSINVPGHKGGMIWGECLFYYQDMAESFYELNIAIDMFWKIWTTVIGYCNKYYEKRKSETFPRLYNSFFEDFLDLIKEDWKFPRHNTALRKILAVWNSEKASKWMDVCLESAYVVSNSTTFRPPRPLRIGDPLEANFFVQIPDFIESKYKAIPITDPDEIIHCS